MGLGKTLQVRSHCVAIFAGSQIMKFSSRIHLHHALIFYLTRIQFTFTQSITLMYSLLKQGFEGKKGEPLAKRCIIVCPTSLVANWANEITKWYVSASSQLEYH